MCIRDSWNTVEILFWSSPRPVAGDGGPTQQCATDFGQIVMSEIRNSRWIPAALHAHGGGSWTIL
eukprot:927776-Pyramimonas_sp.AAC.1